MRVHVYGNETGNRRCTCNFLISQDEIEACADAHLSSMKGQFRPVLSPNEKSKESLIMPGSLMANSMGQNLKYLTYPYRENVTFGKSVRHFSSKFRRHFPSKYHCLCKNTTKILKSHKCLSIKSRRVGTKPYVKRRQIEFATIS